MTLSHHPNILRPCLTWVLGLFLAFGAAAQPNPPDDLYLQDLRTWLKGNWYDGYHAQLGYNQGRREMYGYTDI